MAQSLRCGFFRATRPFFLSSTRSSSSSSDALIELKPGEVGMISGIPQEQLHRRVIIYSPARTASQQGSGKTGKWKINFLSTQKSPNIVEWYNSDYSSMITNQASSVGKSIDGWTSTGDPYANVGEAGLIFDSEEAAIAFAEKHGWEYTVKKRHTPLLKPKAYADNFKWKGPPKD